MKSFLAVVVGFYLVGGLKYELEPERLDLEIMETSGNIVFDSEIGRKMLVSPQANLKSYFQISEHFTTQDTQAYCGVASGTIILNALGDKVKDPVDPVYFPYKYFTQKTLINDPCVLSVMGFKSYFFFMGMTLKQLSDALTCFKSKTVPHYFADVFKAKASDTKQTVISMQQTMMKAIDDGKFIIANIDRPEIEEAGGGHFSPIAAYYKFEKAQANSLAMFLFMDVARYKYKPIWVHGEELMLAMQKTDGLVNVSRGFLVIDANEFSNHQKSNLRLRDE